MYFDVSPLAILFHTFILACDPRVQTLSGKVNMVSRLAGKKTIVVGVPGAFTPTCSTQHVPGFLKQHDALKGKGIQEVLVCSVNDGAVMDAWARDQKIEGSMITFLADTEGNMARSLNLLLDTPKIRQRLGGPRLKRFAMLG